MMIEYLHNFQLDPVDIARVFDSSGIKRPTSDLPRIARMFAESNLVISAWADGALVGVCRALTDYSYCCYLSDLAIDKAYQKHGIGKELIGRERRNRRRGIPHPAVRTGRDVVLPDGGIRQAENAFIINRTR